VTAGGGRAVAASVPYGRPVTIDRRGPRHGDQRRAALLRSLDDHLQRRHFDAINVADIARQAGVTRSAFYFYFENKAVAVAALMEEMYEEAFAAANVLTGSGSPPERIEAAIRGLFDAWERRRHLFEAMLEARAASPVVRAAWDRDRESYVPVIADLIEVERAAGRAPAGPDPTTLATLLLELVDQALARLVAAEPSPERLTETTVAIWLRSVYGTDA
jgi:AcrR family transcriptional regulator